MLQFTLKLKEVPLKLDDAAYVLRELDGVGRDAYATALAAKTRYDSSGKPIGVTDMAGLQGYLLSLCLRDANGVLVGQKVIEGFPARVVEALFNEAMNLSELVKRPND